MANRSYLYSANRLPSRDTSLEVLRTVGIAEFNYDIPIAFMLLVSGNPQRCPSSIWASSEAEAIAGDYQIGVQRLLDFLRRVEHPEVNALIESTQAFLADERNKNSYFLLEPCEIFELGEWESDDTFDELLDYISGVDQVAEHVREKFSDAAQGQQTQYANNLLYSLGVSNWSNILYYSSTEDSSSDSFAIDRSSLSDAKSMPGHDAEKLCGQDTPSQVTKRSLVKNDISWKNNPAVVRWVIILSMLLAFPLGILRARGCAPEQKNVQPPSEVRDTGLPEGWEQSEVFRRLYGQESESNRSENL
ncbi:hypothetical protein Mal64_19080 [Pseudobythopirellula maris]|uniref:DUF7822 domain-containing protein n=1 Tax=Pseudobythopirellula maris TaxID=2527991 RepID=A0A5C5ZNC7_9BACT|nr:hypothetical protein [Pseudobythopirellula maris]TWT88427.1 hypothetical protein Mal64_19080 [Pseudobythopirellula maris]